MFHIHPSDASTTQLVSDIEDFNEVSFQNLEVDKRSIVLKVSAVPDVTQALFVYLHFFI